MSNSANPRGCFTQLLHRIVLKPMNANNVVTVYYHGETGEDKKTRKFFYMGDHHQ